jgi:hypothetical protein
MHRLRLAILDWTAPSRRGSDVGHENECAHADDQGSQNRYLLGWDRDATLPRESLVSLARRTVPGPARARLRSLTKPSRTLSRA